MVSPARRGYILTRHWRDTRDGVELEFWLATDDGPRHVVVNGQTAVAFVRESQRGEVEAAVRNDPVFELRPLAMKTLDQEPVVGLYARNYRAMLRLEKRLAERGIALIEADVRPTDRYLMERFITASVTVEAAEDDAHAVLVNPRIRPGEPHRPTLRIVSLDIETSAMGELYSLALEGCGRRDVYMLGEPPAGEPGPRDFVLTYCADRRAMIYAINAWFREHDPDAIIGWNLVQFDLRLLQACADQYGLVLSLGRGGRPVDWREHGRRENYVFASIPGRLAIDGIEALRSAMWSFPSFSLESVAQALLGEGKDVDDPYHRMDEIERRFREDKPALARYNLVDCELVTRIFAKTRLLDFVLERANATGLPADQSGGSIAAFSHHYLPRMHREGYVAPSAGAAHGESYPGGFVMDSRPGIYDSVLVLDYKSLYPSIIRTFLVDPIGLAEGMLDPSNAVPGPNDTYFSRTRHCLPGIIDHLWKRRDQAKAESNQALSQAFKLLMNAFVGVLGASGGRFFDPRLAAAVTLRGHEVMRSTRRLVEDEGYEAIYGDTDSIFIWLGRAHDETEAMAVADRLRQRINDWWKTSLASAHGIENHLEIEFDTHYARFFMPTVRGGEAGSKKRYAGLFVNDDGEEELAFRGLETVRSDWTPMAQRFQRELYGRIFRREPYADYVVDYVNRLQAGELDDQLVYRKRLRGKLDSYDRTTPPQVRAARMADEYNARHGRPLRYQNGGWISYVMTLAGPEPIEARASAIDHEHYLSNQLEPIADAILAPLGESLAALTNRQPGLF
ncbi:DNA polymerase-2 [Luteibacter sp. UNC138MFCol5.1]|uniref:DNA polymerase II n=1 Tax=Luteibacter sp. UNC138MFCol5.1 TaxID=1502774 RepID=UPI0008D50A2D|nr:DNA polymerase II [Luteibacter sp. UNC138MFCol5.1]SEO32117.1 DNA polymerase-2 [Luteibacter sp. UNC138MFCol5.1]